MRFILVYCLFLLSCNDPVKEASNNGAKNHYISIHQIYIDSLSKAYKLEYEKAPNEMVKNDIQRQYRTKLETFLKANIFMDSIIVTVVKVGDETAIFSDDAAIYTFDNLHPIEEMNSFLKGLVENKKDTIRIAYDGNIQVNSPDANKVFNIAITPAPLTSNK